MIRINLKKPNCLTEAEVEMLVARKVESLGYIDNPLEMACGIKRCDYVKEKVRNIK